MFGIGASEQEEEEEGGGGLSIDITLKVTQSVYV